MGFFEKLFKRADVPPPPPDSSHQPKLAGQTVIKVIYAPSKSERAIISRGTDNVLRVRTEYWCVSDWDIARVAFWHQKHLGTFVDTLDTARRLAHELIHDPE